MIRITERDFFKIFFFASFQGYIFFNRTESILPLLKKFSIFIAMSVIILLQNSRQSTDYNTPITPPHPPKRPRTNSTPRTPLRRSQSLGLTEPNQSSNFEEDNRQSASAGGELNNRRKERIEVSFCRFTI